MDTHQRKIYLNQPFNELVHNIIGLFNDMEKYDKISFEEINNGEYILNCSHPRAIPGYDNFPTDLSLPPILKNVYKSAYYVEYCHSMEIDINLLEMEKLIYSLNPNIYNFLKENNIYTAKYDLIFNVHFEKSQRNRIPKDLQFLKYFNENKSSDLEYILSYIYIINQYYMDNNDRIVIKGASSLMDIVNDIPLKDLIYDFCDYHDNLNDANYAEIRNMIFDSRNMYCHSSSVIKSYRNMVKIVIPTTTTCIASFARGNNIISLSNYDLMILDILLRRLL